MHCLKIPSSCGLATAFLVFASVAGAATVAFNGTRINVDAPGPAAERCGSLMTVNIRNSSTSISTGTSNFGGFEATLSHCVALPLPAPYDLGQFLFEFSPGNSLFGTESGDLTLGASPGVFNNLQNYIVTGGTGIFDGATGAFTGVGTLSFASGPPNGAQTFSGTLEAPAIPEPASWGMIIIGVGFAGLASCFRVSSNRLGHFD